MKFANNNNIIAVPNILTLLCRQQNSMKWMTIAWLSGFYIATLLVIVSSVMKPQACSVSTSCHCANSWAAKNYLFMRIVRRFRPRPRQWVSVARATLAASSRACVEAALCWIWIVSFLEVFFDKPLVISLYNVSKKLFQLVNMVMQMKLKQFLLFLYFARQRIAYI